MYKRKQNLFILLDVVQYFVLLGQNVFIFLKHLSLFHNFCLETGKTVQKAQNSPKAESEAFKDVEVRKSHYKLDQ